MSNFIQRMKQWGRLTSKQIVRPLRGPGGAGAIAIEASLSAVHMRDGKVFKDYGIISTKEVTDAFVEFVVDQLQTETSAFGDFKYHDSGTGNTAEDQTDTSVETKVESGREVGSQTEGASANIYRSVGTITYTDTRAIVEHCLFNAATVGVLMDRSVFTVINVISTDSIQFTYELTIPAGG